MARSRWYLAPLLAERPMSDVEELPPSSDDDPRRTGDASGRGRKPYSALPAHRHVPQVHREGRADGSGGRCAGEAHRTCPRRQADRQAGGEEGTPGARDGA